MTAHQTRRRRLRTVMPVIIILAAAGLAGSSWASLTVLPEEMDSDVVIVIKDKAFHVIKGGEPDPHRPSFLMESGVDHIVTIRNEDNVAHEFVSPYFLNVEVQLSGDATMVFTDNASGFRIDPGKSVTLRFSAPELPEGVTMVEELFWCNIHGKDPESTMRGELVLTQTRREIEESEE